MDIYPYITTTTATTSSLIDNPYLPQIRREYSTYFICSSDITPELGRRRGKMSVYDHTPPKTMAISAVGLSREVHNRYCTVVMLNGYQ